MGTGVVLALFVLCAGFFAANAFRWKRHNREMDRRRERRDLDSRRHHFRGSLDMEADRGQPAPPPKQPEADGYSS